MDDLEGILAAVGRGELPPGEAAERLRRGEVRYVEGFAALDLGRAERKGVPEVVYARAKSPEQVAKICAAVLESEARVVLSAPNKEHEEAVRRALPEIQIRQAGRSLVLGAGDPTPTGGGVGGRGAGPP